MAHLTWRCMGGAQFHLNNFVHEYKTVSLENSFKSNFRLYTTACKQSNCIWGNSQHHLNAILAQGFFFSNFFAGAEWDYSFNFMYDYDIENDTQNMCIIRFGDRQ